MNWYKKAQIRDNNQQEILPDEWITLYRGMNSKFDSNFELGKTDAPYGYSTWTDNKELARQYAGNDGYVYKITLPKSKMGEEIIDNSGERVLFFNNEKAAGLNNISGNEYLVYTQHDDYSPSLISLAKKNINWYKKSQINTKNQLEQEALKYYGETDNIDHAGYILEDGTMINFSEGENIRSLDHRNIGWIEDFGIAPSEYAAGTKIMNRFMNETGAVRVNSSNNELSIHSNTPLTNQQINTIKRNLNNYSSLNIDVNNGITEENSSGDKILNTRIDLQFSPGEGMRFLDNINQAFNPYTPKYDSSIYDEVRDIVGDWEYTDEDIDYDYDTEESINELLGRDVFEG